MDPRTWQTHWAKLLQWARFPLGARTTYNPLVYQPLLSPLRHPSSLYSPTFRPEPSLLLALIIPAATPPFTLLLILYCRMVLKYRLWLTSRTRKQFPFTTADTYTLETFCAGCKPRTKHTGPKGQPINRPVSQRWLREVTAESLSLKRLSEEAPRPAPNRDGWRK